MSNLERAIEKLAKSKPAGRQAAANVLGRVSSQRQSPDSSQPSKFIEFDLDALISAGLVSNENPYIAEQFRALKQPLLKKAAEAQTEPGANRNLVMIASATAGEGKTFTCVNLSLSLAIEKDWEVLLVDVDCKNPQLSRLMGAENEPGLTELLSDRELSLDSLVMSTNIAGLYLLPMGRRDEHAAELLASSRMREIAQELAHRFPNRLTLFDSSPLLLTTEASILAEHAGQIIVVVEASKTPQHSVVDAVHKLDPEKAIGLVLNRARAESGVSYGAYGYEPYPSHAG